MKKPLIIIAVIIVVGIAAYLVISNGNPYAIPNVNAPAAPIPEASAPNAPAAEVPSSVTVSIKNFSFNPSTLTVKTGTKVTWVNDDAVAHTITSDSSNLLNSGTLSPGQSFNFIFTNPGSVTYHCSIHTSMKGTITVQN